jgi:tRNA pseudouridine55 synthase
MARTRGDIGLDGFLNLCKPAGPSSHDVVASARRVLGTRRIGHAGTLDPLAEGVLPLALGRATRLIDRLAAADKAYYAEALLGVRTLTDDTAGEIIEQRSVPRFASGELSDVLGEFVGEIEQQPPSFSALKVGGRRAYELARMRSKVPLSSRRVTIYEIDPRRWEWPLLGFQVRCSKGTYIRALVRDLGQRLQVGACVRRLVRTRVGPFELGDALGLDDLERLGRGSVLPADVLSLDQPIVVLGEQQLDHLRHGRSWDAGGCAALARAYTCDGRFAGILSGVCGRWRPKILFAD